MKTLGFVTRVVLICLLVLSCAGKIGDNKPNGGNGQKSNAKSSDTRGPIFEGNKQANGNGMGISPSGIDSIKTTKKGVVGKKEEHITHGTTGSGENMGVQSAGDVSKKEMAGEMGPSSMQELYDKKRQGERELEDYLNKKIALPGNVTVNPSHILKNKELLADIMNSDLFKNMMKDKNIQNILHSLGKKHSASADEATFSGNGRDGSGNPYGDELLNYWDSMLMGGNSNAQNKDGINRSANNSKNMNNKRQMGETGTGTGAESGENDDGDDDDDEDDNDFNYNENEDDDAGDEDEEYETVDNGSLGKDDTIGNVTDKYDIKNKSGDSQSISKLNEFEKGLFSGDQKKSVPIIREEDVKKLKELKERLEESLSKFNVDIEKLKEDLKKKELQNKNLANTAKGPLKNESNNMNGGSATGKNQPVSTCKLGGTNANQESSGYKNKHLFNGNAYKDLLSNKQLNNDNNMFTGMSNGKIPYALHSGISKQNGKIASKKMKPGMSSNKNMGDVHEMTIEKLNNGIWNKDAYNKIRKNLNANSGSKGIYSGDELYFKESKKPKMKMEDEDEDDENEEEEEEDEEEEEEKDMEAESEGYSDNNISEGYASELTGEGYSGEKGGKQKFSNKKQENKRNEKKSIFPFGVVTNGDNMGGNIDSHGYLNWPNRESNTILKKEDVGKRSSDKNKKGEDETIIFTVTDNANKNNNKSKGKKGSGTFKGNKYTDTFKVNNISGLMDYIPKSGVYADDTSYGSENSIEGNGNVIDVERFKESLETLSDQTDPEMSKKIINSFLKESESKKGKHKSGLSTNNDTESTKKKRKIDYNGMSDFELKKLMLPNKHFYDVSPYNVNEKFYNMNEAAGVQNEQFQKQLKKYGHFHISYDPKPLDNLKIKKKENKEEEEDDDYEIYKQIQDSYDGLPPHYAHYAPQLIGGNLYVYTSASDKKEGLIAHLKEKYFPPKKKDKKKTIQESVFLKYALHNDRKPEEGFEFDTTKKNYAFDYDTEKKEVEELEKKGKESETVEENGRGSKNGIKKNYEKKLRGYLKKGNNKKTSNLLTLEGTKNKNAQAGNVVNLNKKPQKISSIEKKEDSQTEPKPNNFIKVVNVKKYGDDDDDDDLEEDEKSEEEPEQEEEEEEEEETYHEEDTGDEEDEEDIYDDDDDGETHVRNNGQQSNAGNNNASRENVGNPLLSELEQWKQIRDSYKASKAGSIYGDDKYLSKKRVTDEDAINHIFFKLLEENMSPENAKKKVKDLPYNDSVKQSVEKKLNDYIKYLEIFKMNKRKANEQ